MDCAGFESGLVALIERELDPTERTRLVEELRAHAAECSACAGARDLLDTWVAPASERDRADDPGTAYWSDFERRVRVRIDGEGASRPGRGARRLVAAAAVVALVAVGGWILRQGADPPPVVAEQAPPREEPAVPAELPAPLPRTLERELAQAVPTDVLDQVDALAGWGTQWEEAGSERSGSWGAGGLFPDVSELDGEASQALLDWLREQSS